MAQKSNKDRARISVDLSPHQDVVRLLKKASIASGATASILVVESLRRYLPDVIRAQHAALTQLLREIDRR